MSPLRRLATALSAAVSSDEVADAVLRHGLLELGALTVNLWLINRESAALEYVGGAGSVPSEVQRFASIPLGTDLPGTVVVSTREPIVYRSVSERNARWPELASVPSPAEAAVVLPLEARDDIIGCLAVGFAEDRDIDNDELAQLLTAADQCALALDRAHLLDRERRAARRSSFWPKRHSSWSSALDPIVVLDQLLDHAVPLMADWCCVFVHDEERVLRRTALKIADEPQLAERILAESAEVRIASNVPVARAWRTAQPEHIAQPSESLVDELFGVAAEDVRRLGWRDVVVCPIIARGNRVGVITFAFTTSKRRYTSEVLMAADRPGRSSRRRPRRRPAIRPRAHDRGDARRRHAAGASAGRGRLVDRGALPAVRRRGLRRLVRRDPAARRSAPGRRRRRRGPRSAGRCADG